MKKRINKLTVGIMFLTLGCTRGALVMDPYWQAILRNHGEDPAVIAKNMGFSYHVVSGFSDEDLRESVERIAAATPKSKWVILSPWLRNFATELNTKEHRVGLLTMQGLPPSGFSDVTEVYIFRDQILTKIVSKIAEQEGQVLLLYNKKEDFDIFLKYFETGDDLFTIFVGDSNDVQRVNEDARTILALRNIEAVFILAEPYNFELWQVLRHQTTRVKEIYSTGVWNGIEGFYVLEDNFSDQLRSITGKTEFFVQARLLRK